MLWRLREAASPPLSLTALSRLLLKHGVIISPTCIVRIELRERYLLDYELSAFLSVFGLTSGQLLKMSKRPELVRHFELPRKRR